MRIVLSNLYLYEVTNSGMERKTLDSYGNRGKAETPQA